MQAKTRHFVAVRGGPYRGFVPNFFSNFWLGTDRIFISYGKTYWAASKAGGLEKGKKVDSHSSAPAGDGSKT